MNKLYNKSFNEDFYNLTKMDLELELSRSILPPTG